MAPRRLIWSAILFLLPHAITAQEARTDGHGDPLPQGAIARIGCGNPTA